MARKEYTVVDVVDILRRLQNGYSVRAVTRATGMDRNTLRKYLRLAYKKGFGRDGPCDLETIAGEVVREIRSHPPGPQRSLDQGAGQGRLTRKQLSQADSIPCYR